MYAPFPPHRGHWLLVKRTLASMPFWRKGGRICVTLPTLEVLQENSHCNHKEQDWQRHKPGAEPQHRIVTGSRRSDRQGADRRSETGTNWRRHRDTRVLIDTHRPTRLCTMNSRWKAAVCSHPEKNFMYKDLSIKGDTFPQYEKRIWLSNHQSTNTAFKLSLEVKT